MNLMTSITVILLGVFSIVGYKKGLMKTVMSVGCILLALFLSQAAYEQVEKGIRSGTHIDEEIEKKIAERIDSLLYPSAKPVSDNEPEDKNAKKKYWNSPTERAEVIDKLPLPEGIKTVLKDNKDADDVYREFDVKPIVEFDKYIVKMLSSIIINGIAYLVTFVGFFVFFCVLLGLANILNDFPLVGWIDSLGGLALGLVKGLVLVWLVYFFVTMCSSTEWGMRAYYQIQASSWMKQINDNNILIKVLYDFAKTLF